jgi:hypothetical protein
LLIAPSQILSPISQCRCNCERWLTETLAAPLEADCTRTSTPPPLC